MNLGGGVGYVLGVNVPDLWKYEARRVGGHLLAVSPLLAVLLLAVGLGLPGAGFIGDWLTSAAPPLVAGLAAASIVAGERAAELHFSLPTPLRTTLGRRLALLAGSVVIGALMLGAGLLPDVQALSRAALLCSFGALLVAVAAWSAVRLRSATGASAVVLSAWLADLFVLGRYLPEPLARIPAQIIFAAALAVPAWLLLAEAKGLPERDRE